MAKQNCYAAVGKRPLLVNRGMQLQACLKRRAAASRRKKKRKRSAFGSILSEPLQVFLGEKSMPRTEVRASFFGKLGLPPGCTV